MIRVRMSIDLKSAGELCQILKQTSDIRRGFDQRIRSSRFSINASVCLKSTRTPSSEKLGKSPASMLLSTCLYHNPSPPSPPCPPFVCRDLAFSDRSSTAPKISRPVPSQNPRVATSEHPSDGIAQLLIGQGSVQQQILFPIQHTPQLHHPLLQRDY
jgi:hypothetical protein